MSSFSQTPKISIESKKERNVLIIDNQKIIIHGEVLLFRRTFETVCQGILGERSIY